MCIVNITDSQWYYPVCHFFLTEIFFFSFQKYKVCYTTAIHYPLEDTGREVERNSIT